MIYELPHLDFFRKLARRGVRQRFPAASRVVRNVWTGGKIPLLLGYEYALRPWFG